MKPHTFIVLAIACCGLLCSSGCRWKGWSGFVSPWQQQQDAPPILFSSIPPKEELIAALNASTNRVNSLQSQGASVSLAGIPSLPTELAFERPNKLRFRASSSLLGPLVDMGSNEEMLWFWTSQSNPPNVFFARHDRLAASSIRQQLAIDPNMFIEALGFVQLSPEFVVGEPVSADKNRLKLVVRQPTPAGDLTRTMFINAQHGYLMEQQIADAAGRPMLSAKLSQQRYYKVDSVTLPHRVELQMPGEGMRVQLDVPRYQINQPFGEAGATFAFPREQLGQYQMVDIADPNFVPPGQSPPAQYSSPGYSQPGIGQVPAADRYRGAGNGR
ncbi:hypothetical protein ETAA8_31810 [Anatilimnocola aggregata]|uniref:Uncharacterized protein n=1 Tax=Anatilimnocola aggregata TaxID=2528021 RepID=A0A517YCZ0_9BACT|nr:hypothetical protein [Anatilimnocola aggregata]QDU28088.1 hypothetical protein ETAA8_31810 [Anatilimnocola aggregata]